MTWKSARAVGMVTSFFGFYEWARLAVFDKRAVCIHLVQIKWQLIPFHSEHNELECTIITNLHVRPSLGLFFPSFVFRILSSLSVIVPLNVTRRFNPTVTSSLHLIH
jgi:hypothetical protein